MQAGIILLCLGLAIFGITEVPTDGVEFDTGEFGGGSNVDSSVAAQPGTHYTPPAAEDSSTEHEPDPEMGEGTMGNTETPNAPSEVVNETTPQAVDLLDDNPQGDEAKTTTEASALHDLD